ncbi:hypothetical protein [Cytobacillus purgationiresistens]|uniref:Uncharacterized protein n=1 Tax=Cytobacillus purgationiresistens TaxID=863449 RepID=A0ABU0AJ90_9BACI|nr:hypothetical protein [Cytobacillus purgationiresistens]MDQ0270786.1 hypothetical protein [Cytobacillus purgationiresistens]
MEKFIVLNVSGLTPSELADRMNELDKQGYKRAFQSSFEWYQDAGLWGIITFELNEG